MKKISLLLQLPFSLSMIGCMESAVPTQPQEGAPQSVEKETKEWSKAYINSITESREEFAKGKVYSKPDLLGSPDQIGETEWPAEALAKGAAFTPYVHNVAVTTTTVCPALHGRINVDLNKGAGGKYIYLCWGQDDGIKDNSSVPGGTEIRQLMAENWNYFYSGHYLPDIDAANGDFYRDGAVMNLGPNGGYRTGGTITGRFIKPVNSSNGDMNQGAGGDNYLYLYKWYTSAYPIYARLRSLNVVAGSSSVTCPTGPDQYYVNWEGTAIKAEMNRYVGGDHIYVCQTIY
jgi:hypothetical protein